jgi:dihydrofolate reductase
MEDRKVISYVAMSLDGYIAKPDGDISFLSKVEKEGEDYGYSRFLSTIDTIIVGRKTHDKVISIGFEYPDDKNLYIITHNLRQGNSRIKYYSGPLKELVSALKRQEGKNIFCDGGSEVLNELFRENLVDEFVISIIPTILGDGILLFKNGRSALDLQLTKVNKYDSGLVQLHYISLKSP